MHETILECVDNKEDSGWVSVSFLYSFSKFWLINMNDTFIIGKYEFLDTTRFNMWKVCYSHEDHIIYVLTYSGELLVFSVEA